MSHYSHYQQIYWAAAAGGGRILSCCLLIIFPVQTRYTNRILTIFYCTFKIVRFPPKSATYSKNAKFIHLIKGQLTNIKCGTIVSINQLSVFIMPIIIHTSHTMHLFRLK